MADGLVTKHTDLKSLKYGSIPLGSDKPYVTKNIGQAPSSQIGSEISHRIDDVSRIAQMLVDKPGIKYLLNEALLNQATNDRSIAKARKDGKSIVGAVLKQVKYTAQLVGSTLAQVPVNGTGTHFLKGFRTDTYLQPANQGDISAFTSFFGAGGVEGAPYALRGDIVPGIHKTELEGRESTYDYTKGSIRPEYNEIPNYTVPADSVDGITRQQAIEGKRIKVTPSGSGIINTTKNPGTLSSRSNQLTEIIPSEFQNKTGYTGTQNSDQLTYLTEKQNYLTKNNNVTKELRVRLGDQGAPGTEDMQLAKKTNSYWFRSDPNPLVALETDKINALFPNDGKVTVNGDTVQGGQTAGRDLIKFRFHIVTPDGKEKVLYFRAFLDSFADNYSGQWNPVKYLGRAEDFQIYGGFQRKISLSFKIAAASRSEMRPIYEKMIWLASATAPTYANDGQFMRGTITKITLGDYIYELPGVLNSVNYNWNTEYPWEIAMTQPENLGKDDFEQELPMVMDCSIDFTPIHTFTPTTGLKQYITTKTSEGTGKNGIPNISNEKTGLEPIPTVISTALATPPTATTQTTTTVSFSPGDNSPAAQALRDRVAAARIRE